MKIKWNILESMAGNLLISGNNYTLILSETYIMTRDGNKKYDRIKQRLGKKYI